ALRARAPDGRRRDSERNGRGRHPGPHRQRGIGARDLVMRAWITWLVLALVALAIGARPSARAEAQDSGAQDSEAQDSEAQDSEVQEADSGGEGGGDGEL